jgi:hypothetical protein
MVGIQVNADHDVLVTSLRGYWEGARLVSVDCLCQFVYLYKDVIHPLDGVKLCGGESFVPSLILIVVATLTLVNCTPFLCPFMCPFCISLELGKCLEMMVVVRPGHVA